MSDTATPANPATPATPHGSAPSDAGPAIPLAPHEHEHPSEGVYLIVALILGVLTGLEITLYYVQAGTFNTVALLVLMMIKFVIVAGFFMHLRFDSPLFRRFFIGGLTLATFVYLAVLFTFGVFHF